LAIFTTTLVATEVDTSYVIKWHNESWGMGGLIPAGPPWNMVGPFNFDGDGFGDFIVSSSYAGEYCNGVYHYEAAGNDSIELKWVYTFYDLSCSYDAYSSVAVGDIDGDGNQEILSLVDTSPGVLGQNGLQIFEWNPDSMSFLSQPTYTWDMGLDSVWEAGQIHVEDLDGDSKQEIVVSVMDGPWSELGAGGTSRMMIFELDTVINDSAIFNVEYQDEVWSSWSGYNISVGDLDNDGFKEVYTVGYEYFHIVIHENTGEDQYEYQTDFYVSSELYQRANQGIIIADIDNNGTSEMFCLTSGVNSLSGDLLTPGSFFVASEIEDVSSLSFSSLSLFTTYDGGLRQVNVGDADGDGNPNIYIAGHYDEAVYDWEYMGGDPTSPSSYVERVVFLDDTTDNYTPGNDQGKVRVAKLFSGDIDNDGAGDIVFSSASFAADKPHIYMIEHSGTLGFDNEQPPTPKEISIGQNYPNPFNPETRFQYSIHQSDHASLIIYDLLGKEVQTLFDGHRSAGTHVEKWTGIDKNNNMVSSGIYFYQLRVGKERITKKMIFEK
jgi:hypothetical protein